MKNIIYAIVAFSLFVSCGGGLAKKAAKMAAEAGLEEGANKIDENAKAKKSADSKKNLEEILKNHPKGVSASATSVDEMEIAYTDVFNDKGIPIDFTEKPGNEGRIVSAVKTDSRLAVCFNLPKYSSYSLDFDFVDDKSQTVITRRTSITTEEVGKVKLTLYLKDDELTQLKAIKSVIISLAKQEIQEK